MVGAPSAQVEDFPLGTSFALSPDEYIGIAPKLAVKEGDAVQAGDAIFYDKAENRIRVTSPVSGKVKAIVRGEKRRLLQILI